MSEQQLKKPRYSENIATIRVSMVIGGKQVFRARKNVQGIRNQKKVRQELLEELAKLKQKVDGKDILWKDAVEAYIGDLNKKRLGVELGNGRKERRYSEKKFREAVSLLEHTISWNKNWLGEDFTPHKIETLLEGVSVASLDRKRILLAHIRNIFKKQISNGRLKYNPARELYIRVGKQKSPPAVMNIEEVSALLAYTKQHARDWYYIFAVAFYTGARSGELWALRWSNINPASATITIDKSYEWLTGEEKEPKSGQWRSVPINPELAAILAELRAYQVGNPNYDGEHILPRLTDWKQGRAAKILRSYQKHLGITKTKFHGIRATFITCLLAQGVPAATVKELAGHADFKTTFVYVNISGVDKKNATDVLRLASLGATVHPLTPVKPTG